MNLMGNTYGDWEVISKDTGRNWNCKCTTCGKIKSIQDYSILHRTPKCTHKLSNDEMVGLYYGDWKVIGIASPTKLLCKCSCGKEKEVNKYTLLDGRSTNCGHLKNKDRVIDLTDKQFGDLKVLRYLGDQYWECECSCKNICKKHRNHLLDGRAHDCGHSRETGFIDLRDKQFGLLTAKKYVGNKNWECECKCGNTKIIAGANLRNGSIKSCGCLQNHISAEEIIQVSAQLRLQKGRLPFLYELASHFNISDKQMWYFVNSRETRFCINNSFSSKYEREIASLFDSIDNKILGDKKTISPYELDIYLPNYKLAIEFNGNYWHSELQKDTKYHQNKTIACAKKGIQLIHIFEYEWEDECTKEKIKNILLEKVQVPNRIYAKNTIIKEINTEDCKTFLNKYHLQGYTPANIQLGCIHNNELVGVMTFGVPRFGNLAEYELIRLCFKDKLIVVGGANKLFSYFINNYKPTSVLTYVNIAKFTGNIYTKLGFKVQEITKPNYVWYNSNKHDVKSRYTTQKSKLVQSGLGSVDETEDEIMKRLEYTKIYDSGNLRLIWEASNVQ